MFSSNQIFPIFSGVALILFTTCKIPEAENKKTQVTKSESSLAFDSSQEAIELKQNTPRFENFSVSVHFDYIPCQIDFQSHPDALNFKSILTAHDKKKANFAGHYRVISWGCGTQCQKIAVIDCKTGSIYFAPFSTALGFDVRITSSLFVANPQQNILNPNNDLCIFSKNSMKYKPGKSMNLTVDNLLEQALKLEPEERARMAERLLTSLDTETDLEAELAWQKEVQKRVREVDDGEVVCLPWEEVRKRLRRNQQHAN